MRVTVESPEPTIEYVIRLEPVEKAGLYAILMQWKRFSASKNQGDSSDDRFVERLMNSLDDAEPR